MRPAECRATLGGPLTKTDEYAALPWTFHCPFCHAPLGSRGQIEDGELSCECGRRYPVQGGIPDFLTADQRAQYAPFLESYTRIRLAEGRGSPDAEFYCRLPDCPATHPLAWQWRIRACSFALLRKRIIFRLPPRATILDLGAGNGWLSNRLAGQRHRPCAVDINIDKQDGLGAVRHYPIDFAVARASFDCLPMKNGQVDAVVFNSSFHYSADAERTLREALRVLRSGGFLVIMDSPIYRHESSGRKMLAEQHDQFEESFGDRSDSLDRIGFLTWDVLEALGRSFDLDWHTTRPWYGLRWMLRPILARLRGRRAPAIFALVWAKRP